MLRDPNQDRYSGHLPTPVFVNFTASVTNNLIEKAKPRMKYHRQRQPQ